MALDDLALVAEVEAGEGDVLLADVLPDVHLGPVAEREDAEVLAEVFAAVEDVPKLGALVLRVPLAEFVAVGEEAFLRSGLLFIATTTTEAGVELMLLDGVEQGDGLQLVAGGVVAFFFLHAAFVDGFLHEANDEIGTDFLHKPVTVFHGLREVVAGIDVEELEGQTGGIKGLPSEPGHHDGVFAAGEKQRGLFKLRGGFAEDVDGLAFEELKMRDG